MALKSIALLSLLLALPGDTMAGEQHQVTGNDTVDSNSHSIEM